MAAKGRASGKAASKKAAAHIKEEPLCIKGLTGQSLTNKITNVMSSPDTPDWIRKFYSGKLKYARATSQEKNEFLQHLLLDDLNNSPYFKQLRKVVHEQSESSTGEWKSWTEVLTIDSADVIKLGVSQGKILTRPSTQLDHTDPRTQEIAEEHRLQYRYVKDNDMTKTSNVDEVEKGTDQPPPETVDQSSIIFDKIKKTINKTVKTWKDQRADYDGRIDKMIKNQYSGI